jgi:hypothetical protein
MKLQPNTELRFKHTLLALLIAIVAFFGTSCRKGGIDGKSSSGKLESSRRGEVPKRIEEVASPTGSALQGVELEKTINALLSTDLGAAARLLIEATQGGSISEEDMARHTMSLFAGNISTSGKRIDPALSLQVFGCLDSVGKSNASEYLIRSLAINDGSIVAKLAYDNLPPGTARIKAINPLIDGFLKEKPPKDILLMIGSLEYPEERMKAMSSSYLMDAVRAEGGHDLTKAQGVLDGVKDPALKGALLVGLASGIDPAMEGSSVRQWLEKSGQNLTPDQVGNAWVAIVKRPEVTVENLIELVGVEGLENKARDNGLSAIGNLLGERDASDANAVIASLQDRKEQLRIASALSSVSKGLDGTVAFGSQLTDEGARNAYFAQTATFYGYESGLADDNPLLNRISDPKLREQTRKQILLGLESMKE